VGGANAADRGPGRRRDDQEAGNETENEDNENNENDEEEEEEEEADREGPFVPFQCPGSWRGRNTCSFDIILIVT